jgi:hypothetical protein
MAHIKPKVQPSKKQVAAWGTVAVATGKLSPFTYESRRVARECRGKGEKVVRVSIAVI